MLILKCNKTSYPGTAIQPGIIQTRIWFISSQFLEFIAQLKILIWSPQNSKNIWKQREPLLIHGPQLNIPYTKKRREPCTRLVKKYEPKVSLIRAKRFAKKPVSNWLFSLFRPASVVDFSGGRHNNDFRSNSRSRR
jgi:hypothetical protein